MATRHAPSPFSLHTAPAPDPFLFPFTSKASSEGTRSPSQGRCASNPLARLVWVGFLRSNSCVFFCRFLFKMFPFSPPPLSRDGGGKKRKKKKREKKKREVLNESQLAHTRGDGEICTKELPHSLAAFSSRNPAGRRACSPLCITRGAADKGAWPRHPPKCHPGQAGLRAHPVPSQGAPSDAEEPRSHRAPAQLRRLPAGAGWRRHAARSQQAEPHLNKMEPNPPRLIWRCTPARLHLPACTAARRALQKLTPGLQVSAGGAVTPGMNLTRGSASG